MNVSLDDIFPSYVRWSDLKVHDDSVELRLDADEKKLVTDTELALIHPHLPAGVRRLKDVCKHDNLVNTDTDLLLSLWNKPMHVVTDKGLHVAFDQVNYIDFFAYTVRFQGAGLVYRFNTDTITGLRLALPTGNMLFSITVEHAWLDQNYPLWWENYRTAAALDLSASDIAFHMLSKPRVASCTLALPEEIAPT